MGRRERGWGRKGRGWEGRRDAGLEGEAGGRREAELERVKRLGGKESLGWKQRGEAGKEGEAGLEAKGRGGKEMK